MRIRLSFSVCFGLVFWVSVSAGQSNRPSDGAPLRLTIELYSELKSTLSRGADIYLPGVPQYKTGSTMKNSHFDCDFIAVVMVKTQDDILQALSFVRQYGFRPSVKSTGHDYVGRSAGNNTISINLSRMRDVSVNMNDSSSPTGASLTTGPGNTWLDLYTAVDKVGMLIVGGSAHTVSPSGYTLGGGHSPMSRMLGLGVDNVLAISMVTSEGYKLNITDSGGVIQLADGRLEQLKDHKDLWWALLGGGGGTFGIVTSFTFQIHPPPSTGFAHYLASYPISVPGNAHIGQQVLEAWNKLLLNDLTNNWGGYVLINNQPHTESGFMATGTITFSLLHFGGYDEAMPTIALLKRIYPHWMFFSLTLNHSTFLDYEKDIVDETGYPVYIMNRLLQPADLRPDAGLARDITSMVQFPDIFVHCTWVVVGGKMDTLGQNRTSVNKNLRTSLGAMTCGTLWEKDDPNYKTYIWRMTQYARRHLYKHGNGSYFNEPDYFQRNWRKEFWGDLENYERLVEVKRKWDPSFLFRCHNCVGSTASVQTTAMCGAIVCLLVTTLMVWVTSTMK